MKVRRQFGTTSSFRPPQRKQSSCVALQRKALSPSFLENRLREIETHLLLGNRLKPLGLDETEQLQ